MISEYEINLSQRAKFVALRKAAGKLGKIKVDAIGATALGQKFNMQRDKSLPVS